MCNECIVKPYPDRDTVCLDNGLYFLNFKGCVQCGRKDAISVENRLIEQVEDEEITTYKHVCSNCDHVVAEHDHRFEVDDAYQLYTMDCLLCGHSEDSRSILPDDPRHSQALF